MQKRSVGKKELRPGRSSRKETMGRGLQPVTKGRSAGERGSPEAGNRYHTKGEEERGRWTRRGDAPYRKRRDENFK